MKALRMIPGPLLAALALLMAPLRLPALDFEECRLVAKGLPAAFAECANFEVPENPADPSSPPLDLFVARVAALTATPQPDPLVLINGGPGGSSVDLYLQARAAFGPSLLDRDIILLDQRGEQKRVVVEVGV